MFKKVVIIVSMVFCIIALAGGGFFLGFNEGRNYPKTIQVQGVDNMTSASAANVDFGTFWQAWQLLNDNYLRNSTVSSADKVRGAINGLVNSLGDPYTEFFAPTDSQQFQQDVQGNFGGIGAELGSKDSQIVIIAPLKGTPAEAAGILAGDQIIAINGSSTQGMSVDKAVTLIRGPEGTTVTLNIYRSGWNNPKDIKIVRGNIEVPTVDIKTVGGNIALVGLHQFNANADQQFFTAMVQAQKDGDQGMILDLRDDPGGYLEVAVDLAGWFLPKGTPVVSEQGKNNQILDSFNADGNAALVNFPVVVLINKGSASASEILAGALRDDRNIKLIGDTSFGKGTVQQLEDLNDGSSLKITIAHWVLPKGGILENGGLKPDVPVSISDADIAAKKDPQLDKAIEVLKAEITK